MTDVKVGSIVFGPVPDKNSASGYRLHGATINGGPLVQACNCIGPQPGQTKCPCALRGESEMGRKMISDGVVIDGRLYKLVPAGQ